MKKTILFLIILLTVFFQTPLKALAECYIAEGFGDDEYNGIYAPAGTNESEPYFSNGTTILYFFTYGEIPQGLYALDTGFNGSPTQYYNSNGGSFGPQITGTYSYQNGTAPAGTVSTSECAATSTPDTSSDNSTDFGIAIIIVYLSLLFCSLVYNTMSKESENNITKLK